MDDDDFLFFDRENDSFLWDEPEGETDETSETVSTRSMRITAKREMNRVERRQALKDVMSSPPKPGEQIHLVAANKFNFWDWIPVMIDWIGPLRRLYCATWTTNMAAARNLFRLMDDGKIKDASFLLGTYFKRREPAVYASLRTGLLQRKGRIKCFETHAKVVLLDNLKSKSYITIEGSANLTANPRLEQYVITNDKNLWKFYRGWFEEMLEQQKGKFAW